MANSLNANLHGKYVVLKDTIYRGTDIERVFLCRGCNGCNRETFGRSISGEFVFDGEDTVIDGYAVSRFATGTEIAEAKKIRQTKGLGVLL